MRIINYNNVGLNFKASRPLGVPIRTTAYPFSPDPEFYKYLELSSKYPGQFIWTKAYDRTPEPYCDLDEQMEMCCKYPSIPEYTTIYADAPEAVCCRDELMESQYQMEMQYQMEKRHQAEMQSQIAGQRQMEIQRQAEMRYQAEVQSSMAKQQQMEVQRQAEVQRKTEMHGNVGIQKPKLEKESVAEPRMYEIDSPSSKKMAGFLSQFTCAVQNNSEHNIMEFFGDEIQAEELRSKLSPSGQADSISLREELHKFGEITDPVQTLICANKMKNFKPKAGILSGEQQYNLIEGLKNIVSTIIRNSDLSKFEIEDKNAILNMVKQIERSDSVNFGIETKLKQLVDNLNKNSLNFVKNLQTEATKILRRM